MPTYKWHKYSNRPQIILSLHLLSPYSNHHLTYLHNFRDCITSILQNFRGCLLLILSQFRGCLCWSCCPHRERHLTLSIQIYIDPLNRSPPLPPNMQKKLVPASILIQKIIGIYHIHKYATGMSTLPDLKSTAFLPKLSHMITLTPPMLPRMDFQNSTLTIMFTTLLQAPNKI